MARGRFHGKWLVELLVNLPLVLPPVVVGYLLLVAFAPQGPIGSILLGWFGVKIVFSWLGAALASLVMSFPLMVRAIRLSFQAVDPRLELAARSLGAGRWSAFFTVSLPLARRGLVAGGMLAFARSLGELARPSWWPAISKGKPARFPWQSSRSPASRAGWPSRGDWSASPSSWHAGRWR